MPDEKGGPTRQYSKKKKDKKSSLTPAAASPPTKIFGNAGLECCQPFWIFSVRLRLIDEDVFF